MCHVLQGKGGPSETLQSPVNKAKSASKGGKTRKVLGAKDANVVIPQRAVNQKDKVNAQATREGQEKRKPEKSRFESKGQSQSPLKEKARAAGRIPDRTWMNDSSGEESEPELIYPSNGGGLCLAEACEGSILGTNRKIDEDQGRGVHTIPALPIASDAVQGNRDAELQDSSNKSADMLAVSQVKSIDKAEDVPAGKKQPLGGEQHRKEEKASLDKASLPEKPADKVAKSRSVGEKPTSKGTVKRKSKGADPGVKPKPVSDPQRVLEGAVPQSAHVAPAPSKSAVALQSGSEKAGSVSEQTDRKPASLGNKTGVRGPQAKSSLSGKPSGLSGQEDLSNREKVDKPVGGLGSTLDPSKPRSSLLRSEPSGKSEQEGVELGLREKGDQRLERADSQDIEPLSGLEGCAWTQADTDKMLEVLRKVGRDLKAMKVRASPFFSHPACFWCPGSVCLLHTRVPRLCEIRGPAAIRAIAGIYRDLVSSLLVIHPESGWVPGSSIRLPVLPVVLLVLGFGGNVTGIGRQVFCEAVSVAHLASIGGARSISINWFQICWRFASCNYKVLG